MAIYNKSSRYKIVNVKERIRRLKLSISGLKKLGEDYDKIRKLQQEQLDKLLEELEKEGENGTN